MTTRDEAKALLDTRVRVKWGGGPTVALLRAVTPKDYLILAGPGGVETLVELAQVKSLEDARLTCTQCGALVNRTFGEVGEIAGACATCYSDWAKRQPVPHETCEEPDCVERAYYSPLAKKFRCAHHHAQFRSGTGLFVEARARETLAAECRSADKDSDLHDWKKMKSQYVCRKCQVKVFGKPAFAD